MTPDRWARIDKLLDEAMELPVSERSTFLDAVCGEDRDLRNEVESLLAAHQKAEEKFLDRPALDLAALRLAKETGSSLIGQTLGHYSVLSALGVGGMGEVYLARDMKLDRKVALKLLQQQYTSDAARIRRFEREARAASALNHPNIITIYEIDQIESRHFIAAEFVDGKTLRELLSGGRIAAKDAVEIAIQAASALSAAHRVGIVHRDIKPENVMWRRDGYVKVLDFGLVKLIEQSGALERTNASEGDIGKTNPGAVLGTVRYMSPEQALGQEVDSRSDLFSLGVVLYELLTGAPPFKGAQPAGVLDAIVHYNAAPLTQIRPDLHSELERIVGRALEKDRDLRYQTANDLRADLKRLQRDLDSSLRVAGASKSGARTAPAAPISPIFEGATSSVGWKLKGPLAATAMVLLILLVAAVTVIWRLWTGEKTQASPWGNATQMQITDFPGEELFPSLSPNGKEIVFARRNTDGNLDIWRQHVGGSKADNLTPDHHDDDTQPAFSPDGGLIAFRSEREGGGIYVMGASGESPVCLTRGLAFHPTWAPGGKEVIFTEEIIGDPRNRGLGPRKLWAVNTKTLERRPIADHDIAQPSWSPNGHRIAYWGQRENAQRDIWTMPAQGGKPEPVTDDAATDWNPIWAPDGKHLYFSSDRTGAMNLWRVPIDERTGKTLGKPELVPTPSAFSQHISFSADGKQLAFVDLRPRFRLVRVAFDPTREALTGEVSIITETSWRIHYLDVSPDGSLLAYNSTVGAREDLYLIKTDGSAQPQKLTDDDDKDRFPRWSPDGKRIAFFSNRSGQRWQIWMINRDGSGRQPVTAATDGDPFFPIWSPKGERLAYALRKSSPPGAALFIVDLSQPLPAQGQQLIYDPQIRFWPRDWSPDGKWLIGGWRANNEAATMIKAYSLETNQFEDISNLNSERPVWMNDSRRALFTYNGKLFVVDTQTRKAREVFARLPYQIRWYALSRDQRTIYFAQDISEANVWALSQK